MGIKDGTTTFELSRPIEYRHNGDAVETTNIVLKEPGMDHVQHYLKLKQLIMQSQMGLAKYADKINEVRDSIGDVVKPLTENVDQLEEDTKSFEKMISFSLQTAENIDIAQFISIFKTMATMKGRTSICMIDGRRTMTGPIWDTLKPDDAFDMAIRWCAFFAMPSIGGDRISSGQPSDSVSDRTVA